MKYWIYINYKIYEFYENTSESMPAVYSAGISAVLVNLNLLSAHYIIYLIFGVKIIFHISILLFFYALILLINYFTIYKNKRYERLFEKMEDWEYRDRKPALFFNLYFLLSTAIFFITIVIGLFRET